MSRRTGVVLTTLFCILGSCVVWGARAKSTLLSPDFAFPADVRAEAIPAYEKALKEKDGPMALLTAMELNVAANAVSRDDSVSVILGRYAKIADSFKAPYSGLAKLLEAKYLTELYMSNSGVYDQRVLPEEEAAAEPTLWSGRQYRTEITRLLEEAISEHDVMKKTPISEISLVINNGAAAEKAGMSVLDFATYQVLEIISRADLEKTGSDGSIPFITDRKEKMPRQNKMAGISSLGVLNNLIGSYNPKDDAESEALLIARLKKYELLEGNARKEYARELMETYPVASTIYPQFILYLYQQGGIGDNSGVKGKKGTYAILKECVEAHPDSKATPCLKTYMSDMTLPCLDATTSDQWLPGGKAQLTATIRNLKEAYLLLVPLGVAQGEADRLTISSLKPAGEIIVLQRLACAEEAPSEITEKIDVDLGALGIAPGYYAIVPSAGKTLAGVPAVMKKDKPSVVNVSMLSVFSSKTPVGVEKKGCMERVRSEKRLYVVNGADNTPVKGASVTFTTRRGYNATKGSSVKATTNAEGYVKIPADKNEVLVTYKGNRLKWWVYDGNEYRSDPGEYSANILPDLGIYHPGDSLRCAVVVARNDSNLLLAAKGVEIAVQFSDANGKAVGSETVTTDDYGRAVTGFMVPSEGLTGSFNLIASIGGNVIGRKNVEVADYKVPTFIVTLDKAELDSAKNTIEITGRVSTYSGMPLSETDVNVDISYSRMWWRCCEGPASGKYGEKTQTDEAGRFKLKLGVTPLFAEGYDAGIFRMTATATSESGETQTSAPQRFTLSEGWHIQASDKKMKVEGDSVSLPVKVVDFLGNPAVKELAYNLKDKTIGKVVSEGSFQSPALIFSSAAIPSGRYEMEAVLKNAYKDYAGGLPGVERNDTARVTFTIWRADDSRPPYETSLWVPEQKLFAAPGADTAEITIGDSYPEGMIYCQIADRENVMERSWVALKGQNGKISVPAPKAGNKFGVRLRGMHDLEITEAFVEVLPAEEDIRLEIETMTFRDKINPLGKETWKFRLRPTRGEYRKGAALAVMSNAALDAIAPFNWSYTPERILSGATVGSIDEDRAGSLWISGRFRTDRRGSYNCSDILMPEWNLWGHSMAGHLYIRGTRYYTMNMKRAPGVMNAESVVDEVYLTGAVMEKETGAKDGGVMADLAEPKVDVAEYAEEAAAAREPEARRGASEEELQMRDVSCPLAFFKPMLEVAEDGVVTIDFDVPNFNTTWKLQLLGYDASMKGDVKALEAVASKPVMVSMNLPRFLLTGDKAEISAMVFNNTEASLPIAGEMEVFDITTGNVIAHSEMAELSVKASGSVVMSVRLDVAYDISQVGVRAIARSAKGSDGEQGAVAVLPSSRPVRDAYTFYLLPGATNKTVNLPRMKEGGKVTLNYCDNPSWYVLTALSGLIEPDSESALVNANALYANAVSSGLLAKSPKLSEGLRKLFAGGKADSLLISPLSRNSDLKIAGLNATPWVNNAEDETARMSSLNTLLDAAEADKAINTIVEKLAKTQKGSGGWSWMKEMDESLYITTEVLGRLGSLRQAGFLPDNQKLDGMVKSGLKYADKETGKDYADVVSQGGRYPLGSEVDYLYMRGNLTTESPSGNVERMQNDMLKRLPEEWRGLAINEKATAAILLMRHDKAELASEILESLSQTASYKEDKGMWFDNLLMSTCYFRPSALAITARVLEAYKAVKPQSPDIERLCQYLVLSRQTQDWNNSMSEGDVAGVVNAVMSAVPGWAEETSVPRLYIDGKELALPSDTESLTGGFYMNLDASSISGKELRIEKVGKSPSWGGIVCQYVESVSKVKAHGVPQLKIEKRLLPVTTGAAGEMAQRATTNFKKGDKIKVTLTLMTDRELDYLLVKDGRSACLEPAEQLTRYYMQEGLWILRETRNYSTNFYITHLPKGKYQLSYETYADRDGEYSSGIAEAQSQYYPLINAHSGGSILTIKAK